MGIEFEAQTKEEHQAIKTRELQQESVEQLNQVSDLVNDINFDNIQQDSQVIRQIVTTNLENQVNNDDLDAKLDKIAQGISDVKRSQTNLNKKINEIQEKIGE